MRAYPQNSPQAAARVVALFLMADGHPCRSEVEALARHDLGQTLALSPDEFARIIQTLCEDQFWLSDHRPAPGEPTREASLTSMLHEIDDPLLQKKILQLSLAATVADHLLADAEISMLSLALKCWPLAHENSASSELRG